MLYVPQIPPLQGTTIFTPSDGATTSATRVIHPVLQFPAANNARYAGRLQIYLDSTGFGNIGVAAPSGCKVGATFTGYAYNTPSNDGGPVWGTQGFVPIDGSSLSGTDMAVDPADFETAMLIQIDFIVEVGSAGAGAVGLAWSSAGTMPVKAGSNLVWWPAN